MLPKKNRATTLEVEKIFKASKLLSSSSLSFRYFKNSGQQTKISFIAPKSVAKLAVGRNMLRRRGYSALEKHLPRFPAVTGVFVFKKYQNDTSILSNEIENILNKIN
ncbi:hypothetical protein A3A03_01185 [Candidatus Nomurabacteria bacterium RIFCSPLOWO2_01_FULL_40_18]|uniref:Uncharacterized protein n=1 Tax=Candidatus Nomurabacteria bacterium RIFCSPLOWO2_01_FULL_40_18 TaxID=1801773 RepID=A0A1F6XKF2_9BACT|nr:MAG: hypothetical protein A3A03_01185 [Candidatus Nomurabacteria bacterium RIFCSPLOWO2_01_FULL_40_18]